MWSSSISAPLLPPPGGHHNVMLFDRVSLSVHNGHTENPHCHQQQRRYCHRRFEQYFHLVQSSFAVLRPFISRPLVGWTGPVPACAGEPRWSSSWWQCRWVYPRTREGILGLLITPPAILFASGIMETCWRQSTKYARPRQQFHWTLSPASTSAAHARRRPIPPPSASNVSSVAIP